MAKAAANAPASKKPPTKSEILNNIAAATNLAKKDVANVFEALAAEIKKHVGGKGAGVFTIPGLVKVTRKKVAARPAQKGVKNPFTGELQDRPERSGRANLCADVDSAGDRGREPLAHTSDPVHRAKAPAREPDLTLFVDSAPNPSFIDRLPNLEFMEVFQKGASSEDAPNGWWSLRLWIR